MIDVDFSRTKNGFRLHIEGHADYGKSGNDIVCASVSGIFYALCGYLLNFKRDTLRVNEIKSGLADIECGLECEDYLQLACLGFWQIAMSYPEHVRLKNRAWRWRMNPDHIGAKKQHA